MLLEKVNIIKKVSVEELRILSSQSQKDFANMIGMPYGTYRKKERGETGFLARELNNISLRLNVPMDKIKI